jgi:hypothetical protein
MLVNNQKGIKSIWYFFLFIAYCMAYCNIQAQVIGTHPRLLLNSTTKTPLIAKKNANDPTWLALKAEADQLLTYSILSWNENTVYSEPNNTIAYTYQGGGWYDAVTTLGMAHQISKGTNSGTFATAYSDKLLALADTIIAAQDNYYLYGTDTIRPIRVDSYYPSRFICRAVALLYDWCYDELGTTRRNELIAVMNQYFDATRNNGFQTSDRANGNYFTGHLVGMGYMGYASYGDNAQAQTMIDWARNRFDGTVTPLVANDTALSNVVQLFEGGYKIILATETYNNPTDITGAPCKGGFYVEGWAYGNALGRILDYMKVIETATGENIIATRYDWLVQLFKGQLHSSMPNRSEIDFFADYGGSYGAFMPLYLATRLAYYLHNTPEGAEAQYFRYQYLQAPNNECVYTTGFVFPDALWERFYFEDLNRPSAPIAEPTFYSGFDYGIQNNGNNNGALAYFLMRNNWDTAATWASVRMGNALYEGHEHRQAGHVAIKRNNDYLLIESDIYKSTPGQDCGGLVGNNPYLNNSANCNTLFFNDYGDYMYTGGDYFGGQSWWGYDKVVAAEQNAQFSYSRADLTPAYFSNYDTTQWINRKLDYFYRNFLYLQNANVMVVFDQVKAKSSSNPLGQYDKHLRWHTPGQPILTGNNRATIHNRQSTLYLHTILPTNANVTIIDQSNNPDNSYYGSSNNTPTWRLEIKNSDPNILEHPFLTVLQPGNANLVELNSSYLSETNNLMDGVRLVMPDNSTEIVLFNRQNEVEQSPITTCSYLHTNTSNPSTHTLCGMLPNANYQITQNNGTITVQQVSNGIHTASETGILRFCTFAPTISGNLMACTNNTATYSVPAIAGSTYNWTANGGTIVSGQGTNTISILWSNGTVGTIEVVQITP